GPGGGGARGTCRADPRRTPPGQPRAARTPGPTRPPPGPHSARSSGNQSVALGNGATRLRDRFDSGCPGVSMEVAENSDERNASDGTGPGFPEHAGYPGAGGTGSAGRADTVRVVGRPGADQ